MNISVAAPEKPAINAAVAATLPDSATAVAAIPVLIKRVQIMSPLTPG